MKGITQNVVPYSDGWVVYEGWRPDTLRFFNNQEEAMDFAMEKAHKSETPILLHSALPAEPEQLTLLIMGSKAVSIADGC